MQSSASHISFPRLKIFEEVIVDEFVTSLWRFSTLETMSELVELVNAMQETYKELTISLDNEYRQRYVPLI